jgi:hypothetical protein
MAVEHHTYPFGLLLTMGTGHGPDGTECDTRPAKATPAEL